jgi:hypothetical protein
VDFDTPNARNASGRGGRTAAFKFYELRDNLTSLRSSRFSLVAAVVGFLISRFPDTRRAFGDDLDDALYKGGVQALWLFIALAAIALLALWLVP